MRYSYGLPVTAGLIFALVALPITSGVPLPAQTPAPAPTPAVIQLSPAVLSAAITSMRLLVNKVQAGTLQAGDVQEATVAVGTLFAYLQETGMNDQLQASLLAEQDDIVNNGPTEERIETLYAQIRSKGVNVQLGQFRNSMFTTSAARQQMITQLQKFGLWGIEQETLASLQQLQQELSSNEYPSAQFAFARLYPHGSGWLYSMRAPHLEPVHYCYASADAVAWGALALIAPPPVDIVSGIMSLYYGVAGMILGC